MIGKQFVGLLIILGFTGTSVFAQVASGVIIKVNLGPHGSATELITAPNAGKPLSDPNWIHETLPDGTANPAFPPPISPPVTPPQDEFPGDFIGIGEWSNYGVPGTVAPTPLTSVEMPELLAQQFTVLAWKSWQNSGISVKVGSKIEIKATGRWSTHLEENWSGPEGYESEQTIPNRPGHPPMPSNFSKPGELIGRIGEGDGFRVGAEKILTADHDGNLWFTINDTPDGAEAQDGDCTYCGISGGHVANNRGQVVVTVTNKP